MTIRIDRLNSEKVVVLRIWSGIYICLLFLIRTQAHWESSGCINLQHLPEKRAGVLQFGLLN